MTEASEIQSLDVAVGFSERAKGLFSKRLRSQVLLLTRCRSIHTVGMSGPIDVAFIDRDGRVLKTRKGLPPGRFMRCWGASAVLERKIDGHQKEKDVVPWFEVGEEVKLCIKK